ncbi:c6 and c2h2 transcription factor [Neofusicoccum parvum]|uniref:C6 and c2h2 transcription factor n=1 Tax=Neofusicoccum parvum TaxID=310453 RepID=A0ACB5SC81_9PEZI|nr:c6 and c2h2 transcription factor [Neofusicoccum parvum]
MRALDRPSFTHDFEVECDSAFELQPIRNTLPAEPLLPHDAASIHDRDTTATLRRAPLPNPTNRQKLKDLWFWEIFSIALSFSCNIAIAAILAVVDGKALSSWTMPIRPNALISVFAAFAKSALILPLTECISQYKWLYFSRNQQRLQDLQTFDDASRGPLGSLVFLWKLKANALLPSFACVLMVACLAVDPFAQQIISYPLRSIATGNSSDAVTWATDIYDTGRGSSKGAAVAMYSDPTLQAAIFSGLFDRPAIPALHCASGNCTWPDITTLGICSRCANKGSWTPCSKEQPMGGVQADDAPIRDQTLKCTYETPSGLHVDFCRGKIPGRDNLYWTRFNATAELTLSTLSNITHHAFVRVHEDVRKPGTTGQDYGIEALECTLYWCARTNSGLGVTNGVINPGNVTRTPLAGIRDLTTINQDSEFPIQLTTLVAPESWNGTKRFTMNVFDMVCIADLIQVLLHTSLLTENYYMYRSNTYRTAYALWKSPSLATTMDNVAESLTNAMRRTQNSTMITGQSFHDETYMRVRRAWFALPASLVICTAGTLITLAIINDRHNVLLWKSSMLPLLFYGFEKPIDAPVQKLSHVDARAQNTKVRLHTTESNDLRFVLL